VSPIKIAVTNITGIFHFCGGRNFLIIMLAAKLILSKICKILLQNVTDVTNFINNQNKLRFNKSF
ncbi:MAG: hypothetical protein RBS23_04235, partial [Mariniphaga sp.]|nr:hypothetical protein [Mariniphaga sp.]